MRKLLLPCLFLTFTTIHPVIISYIELFNAKRKQHIYLFGDMHLDYEDLKTTMQQQEDLFTFVTSLDGSKMVVVEDMISGIALKLNRLDPDWRMEPINKQMVLSSPLDLSTARYALNNIPVFNAEFRLMETQSGYVDTEGFKKVIKALAHYNDNKALNDFYKKAIENTHAPTSLEEFLITQLSGKFNEMLDARVLHFIYRHPDVTNIVVLAGDQHTGNIRTILIEPELDYTTQRIIGVDFINLGKEIKSLTSKREELEILKTENLEHQSEIFTKNKNLSREQSLALHDELSTLLKENKKLSNEINKLSEQFTDKLKIYNDMTYIQKHIIDIAKLIPQKASPAKPTSPQKRSKL